MQGWSVEQGWRRPVAISVGFVLIALFIIAGAMGLALGVALTGLLAIPPVRQIKTLLPLELPLAIFLIFIAWAWLSMRWTSYPQSEQAWKMAVGVVLYSLFAYGVWSLRGKARLLALYAAAFSILAILLAYFAIASFNIFELIYADAPALAVKNRDATRGVSALVCAIPCVWAFLHLLVPGWRGKAAGILVGLLAMFICWRFQLASGMLAIIVAAVLFGSGWFFPRTTILLVGLGAVASFMLAPMLTTLVIENIDKSSVSFSWELRLRMWEFAIERINEKSLFGWGLDASRTFNDTIEVRGYQMPIISLHPHNFGLQIWLETGLIGVFLFSAAAMSLAVRVSTSWSLSRLQGAAIAACSGAILVFANVTFGAWQEWFWACAAWVAAMCFLIGPEHQEYPQK